MAAALVKRSTLDDKVFLVSGGAAGIGAGVAKALLAENARHVAFLDVAGREGSALEAQLLNKFGALRAKFIKCDISDDVQLATAYKQVLDKYHRLDGVINCAAILSSEESMLKRMVDINFTATVNSTYKALEAMGLDKGGNGGVVVNMSSLLALKPGTHLPAYSATKAAVLQFSVSIGAPEIYSKTGVRILTVCLGPTDTAFLHRNNSENFEKISVETITSRVAVKQRVESAVTAIIDVINKGKSGSVWIVENDMPAYDHTDNIVAAFEAMSKS